MKQATRKPVNHQPLALHLRRRLQEVRIILTVAIAIFLLIAFFTYHASDPGWSASGTTTIVANAGGKAGAWFADLLLYICGYTAYLFPILLLYTAITSFYRQPHPEEGVWRYWFLTTKIVAFLLVIVSASGLTGFYLISSSYYLPYSSGGILGNSVAEGLLNNFNIVGASLVLFALLLIGITLFTGLSWLQLAEVLGKNVWSAISWALQLSRRSKTEDAISAAPTAEEQVAAAKSVAAKAEKVEKTGKIEPKLKMAPLPRLLAEEMEEEDEDEPKFPPLQKMAEPIRRQSLPDTTVRVEMKKESYLSNTHSSPAMVNSPSDKKLKANAREDLQPNLLTADAGLLPPLTLLDLPDKNRAVGYTHQQLENMSHEVELRLQDFGVAVKVVAVHPGPVVTRFELQLAAGTKVSRVSNLSKDLARSLSVTSVRVVEVIPGKSVIGLELPNEQREIVRLREILASQQYDYARSPVTLALGKDIAGHPVIVDLAKMPHLLVAGTTGAGKSVCLNALLLSLLYKSTPQELRLILIDPKMLELAIYEGIPHLLVPVVIDMKEAANALRWSVAEMDRRYRLMANLGVRNISGFNSKIKEARAQGKPLLDPFTPQDSSNPPVELEELPYIVILADEFADMMMVVGKKIEELIARLAQKARAAGIHLIMATQRPSVDVITGLIKANIPTRIAFQVSSKIDSRTILDQSGAEQLLGQGDMLYLAPGTGVPVRVHGAFVADEEVHRVVAELKKHGTPRYLEEILQGDGSAEGGSSGGSEAFNLSDAEQDPLYDQAVQIILETRRASISGIQRRLKIGYNRAARIVEGMEQAGLVSAMDSNGNRDVLVPKQQ